VKALSRPTASRAAVFPKRWAKEKMSLSSFPGGLLPLMKELLAVILKKLMGLIDFLPASFPLTASLDKMSLLPVPAPLVPAPLDEVFPLLPVTLLPEKDPPFLPVTFRLAVLP
jgi:hypothetical protein